MRGSVTQAYRILLLGDEKYGFRFRGIPFILTSFCLAPFGNENGLKCCLKVSCCTLGQRKCSEVSPKRAVFYSWATKSMGFVAEESHSSLRHSALHLSATKKHGSVAQACRAALSGDENVRKCCLSVPRCTLGRRKVWISLPKSPFILTSFCPTPTGNKNGRKCRLKVSYCTLGRRKCSEVSPKRAALHPRATKSVGFVAEESPFILTSFCPTPTGNKNGRKCRLNVSCRTLGRRRSAEVSPERAVLHSWVTILG